MSIEAGFLIGAALIIVGLAIIAEAILSARRDRRIRESAERTFGAPREETRVMRPEENGGAPRVRDSGRPRR